MSLLVELYLELSQQNGFIPDAITGYRTHSSVYLQILCYTVSADRHSNTVILLSYFHLPASKDSFFRGFSRFTHVRQL